MRFILKGGSSLAQSCGENPAALAWTRTTPAPLAGNNQRDACEP